MNFKILSNSTYPTYNTQIIDEIYFLYKSSKISSQFILATFPFVNSYMQLVATTLAITDVGYLMNTALYYKLIPPTMKRTTIFPDT